MKSGTLRVQRRREKLRAAGLRPIQIWVPDTNAPGFAEECARRCRVLAAPADADADADADVDAWLDAANQQLADDLERQGL